MTDSDKTIVVEIPLKNGATVPIEMHWKLFVPSVPYS